MSKEFNILITEINKYSSDPISKYDQVIKGEPPSSKSSINLFLI